MESPKEKMKNHRKEDEKRNPASKNNSATTEREWDPEDSAKNDWEAKENDKKNKNSHGKEKSLNCLDYFQKTPSTPHSVGGFFAFNEFYFDIK